MSDTEEKTEVAEAPTKMVLAERPLFVNPKTYAAFDAKPKAAGKKKNKKNKYRVKFERGYMYIGHLPHGFYEEQCKAYFAQFGRVCRIKLARSKDTGRHKGYGFIEFENEEVAKIAAETMNNYLMFNKLLKCQLISKEKLHKLTFKNAKKNFFLKLDSTFRKRFNADKSDDKLKRIEIRNSIKLKKRQEKLKEAGIDLDLSKLNTLEIPEVKEEEVNKTQPKKKEAAKAKVEAKKASVVAKKAPEAPKPAEKKPAKKQETKKQPEPPKAVPKKQQAEAAKKTVAKKQPVPVKTAPAAAKATNKKAKSKK